LGPSIEHPELGLNETEFRIVRLLCRGLRPADVARDMHCTPALVSIYMGNIVKNLGLKDRDQIVPFAKSVGV
jgi:DNA-binding CsgD family transcriptional regulator